jgi:hypothetical protein
MHCATIKKLDIVSNRIFTDRSIPCLTEPTQNEEITVNKYLKLMMEIQHEQI